MNVFLLKSGIILTKTGNFYVSLPSQKGWAWVQLLPHQKLSNFEIICHLAERDDPQNSAKITKTFKYGEFAFVFFGEIDRIDRLVTI